MPDISERRGTWLWRIFDRYLVEIIDDRPAEIERLRNRVETSQSEMERLRIAADYRAELERLRGEIDRLWTAHFGRL